MNRHQNTSKPALYSGHRQTVGDRLKEYMRLHNLKQVDILDMTKPFFTDKVKVTKTDLSQYINNKTEPRSDKLHILAKGLNVDEAWLLGFDDATKPHKLDKDLVPSNIEYLYKSDDRLVRIPIIGTIACGEPIMAEQNIDGYTSQLFDHKPAGDLFALRCKGHSMEPTIPDGAIVIVHQQPEVEDGEIAAVQMHNDGSDTDVATLKRVKHANGEVLLMPDNQSFDPIVVNKKSHARIIGKAIRIEINL